MVLIKEKDPDVSFNARNTELTGQLTIVCIFNNMMWIFFKKKKKIPYQVTEYFMLKWL